MNDKLAWDIKGETFVDGSHLSDWEMVYQSPDWHWQYDTHEMTFEIYKHVGQFWKLYLGRYVLPGETEYTYDYGGVACRIMLVKYRSKARSPHSSMLKERGEEEWIRTNEYDPIIHSILKQGETLVEHHE